MKKKLALVLHSLDVLLDPAGVKGGSNYLNKQLLNTLLERDDLELLLLTSQGAVQQYKNLSAIEFFVGSIYTDAATVWPQIRAVMQRYPQHQFLFSDVFSPVGHLLLQCHSVPHRLQRLPGGLQRLKQVLGGKRSAKKLQNQQQVFQNKNRLFFMVSNIVKQDYAQHFQLPAHQCVVAHPGVVLTPGQTEGNTLAQTRPRALTSLPVVGMVGGRSLNKGVWLLLLALLGLVACRQPFQLVLVHPNLSNDGLTQLLLTPLRWFRPVTVLPFQANLQAFYQQLHVLVLPSNNEAFGLVTLEGMAEGVVPIVASTAGSAELIKQGQNGFVFTREKRPVASLFQSLRHCLSLPQHVFSSLQQQALTTAQQATWHQFTETLVAALFTEPETGSFNDK